MVEKDDVKDVKARRLKCLTILKKRDGGAHEVMEAYNELCGMFECSSTNRIQYGGLTLPRKMSAI